jgi:hypothetical protein
MKKKDYIAAKLKISSFVLKEIDNGDFSDEQIAKMLIEISLTYLNATK